MIDPSTARGRRPRAAADVAERHLPHALLLPVPAGEVPPPAVHGTKERLRHGSVCLRVAIGLTQVPAAGDEAHQLRRRDEAGHAQVDGGHILPACHLRARVGRVGRDWAAGHRWRGAEGRE